MKTIFDTSRNALRIRKILFLQLVIGHNRIKAGDALHGRLQIEETLFLDNTGDFGAQTRGERRFMHDDGSAGFADRPGNRLGVDRINCPQINQFDCNVIADLVNCLKADTGDRLWRERLGGGKYQASPVAGAEKLYFTSVEGLVTVLKPGPTFAVLARNKLEENIVATPALSNGRIFIRGEKHLFCIEESKK